MNVIFASDNNYVPYLAVAIKSLLANASPDYFYKIHILTTNLDKDLCVKRIKELNPDAKIFFVSSKTGEGFEEWISYLKKCVEDYKN